MRIWARLTAIILAVALVATTFVPIGFSFTDGNLLSISMRHHSVYAQSGDEPYEEPSTVGTVSAPPIVFSETADYIKLDFTMFAVEFYKGTYGYNKVYDSTGNVLVHNDRVLLEYFKGNKWQQRATPQNLTWEELPDPNEPGYSYYKVHRHYTDFLNTHYTVTFTVRRDQPMKFTLTLENGITDSYRIAWYLSGTQRTSPKAETNRLVFGDETIEGDWVAFDWSDVHQDFGDITTHQAEVEAGGITANIYFNIGTVGAGSVLVLDPSTVGTSTSNRASSFAQQRKAFIAHGREWLFYSDGTDLVFDSRVISPLGSWKGKATFKAGLIGGYKMSLDWDGTYVHAQYQDQDSGTGAAVMYRRGTPASDGTFSWGSEVTAVAAVSGKGQQYSAITLNSGGYPVMVYSRVGTTYYMPYVKIATATDGSTWGTEVALDSEGSDNKLMPVIVALPADNKLVAVWEDRDNDKYKSKYFDGTSWGTIRDITDYTFDERGTHSLVAIGSTVLCSSVTATGKAKVFAWTADSWDAGTEIDDGTAITISRAGTGAYAFVRDGVNLYSVQYNGSWGTPQMFQASMTDFTHPLNLSSAYCATSGRISVYWLEGTSSPYNVRYKAFTYPEITSTPDSYDFGTLEVNTTSTTGLDYFTITNTGGVAVDITIQGTDLTGGAKTEEQELGGSLFAMSASDTRVGQQLTISSRYVTSLSFSLMKVGSPTGDVTFTFRSVSTGTVLASKVWGDAADLGALAWVKAELDPPVLINEEVRVLVEYSGSDTSNYVVANYRNAEVKADENWVHWDSVNWQQNANHDCAYRYEYEPAWTLAADATPAANTYGLKAGLEGGDYTVIVKKTEAYNTLKTNLAPAATQKWGLKLWMPTSVTNYDGQEMSGTVTLVASASS